LIGEIEHRPLRVRGRHCRTDEDPQMQHRQIVPSLHSAQLNPHIDFAKSPFIVSQELIPWEPQVIDGRALPRTAGLSSFGAGGSNAHLIIEEHQATVRRPAAAGPFAIVLSARTPEHLQQKSRDLLGHLRARGNSIDLASVAFTLQSGREAMEERLAFVVTSVEQLTDKLAAFVAGEQGTDDSHQGQVKRNSESLSVFSSDPDLQHTVEKWMAGRKLAKLLDLWVKGLDLDWNKLYGETTPQRVSLPAYPFAKDRYWIDIAPAAAVKSTTAAALHPLLHSNTSDLGEQRYSSTFREPTVLSAAALLEMARAAVEHATPERPESALLELRDVVWTEVDVRENDRIHVALFTDEGGTGVRPHLHLPGDTIGFEIYGDDETIHCQGHAVWSREPAPRVPRTIP
jgi:acyl transferase domain-containing protein